MELLIIKKEQEIIDEIEDLDGKILEFATSSIGEIATIAVMESTSAMKAMIINSRDLYLKEYLKEYWLENRGTYTPYRAGLQETVDYLLQYKEVYFKTKQGLWKGQWLLDHLATIDADVDYYKNNKTDIGPIDAKTFLKDFLHPAFRKYGDDAGCWVQIFLAPSYPLSFIQSFYFIIECNEIKVSEVSDIIDKAAKDSVLSFSLSRNISVSINLRGAEYGAEY